MTTQELNCRRVDLCLHRQALPLQLVPYHPAFRAEHLFPVSDPGPCSWFGVSIVKEQICHNPSV